MSSPCILADVTQWLGIHYLDDTTVTLTFIDATLNAASPTATMVGGATSWTVKDGNGVVVGSGTMSATATAITVVSSGAFVGGSTIVPGYFTVYTNSGTNLVCAGMFVVCPTTRANSKLWVPPATFPDSDWALESSMSAWIATAQDRENYELQPLDGISVADYAADAYFSGPQDSARPHLKWTATAAQAGYPTQDPTPANWATLASDMVAAGFSGATYELPTNEPENGGWAMSDIITYWNACAAAVLAADPTAQLLGWCSGGIYDNSPLSAIASFLAHTPAIGDTLTVTSTTQAGSPATGISGGPVASWTLVSGGGTDTTVWQGTVNANAGGTITVTYGDALQTVTVVLTSPTGAFLGTWSNSNEGGGMTSLSVDVSGGISYPIAGFSNHMEQSHQNLSNIVALREYIGSLKAQFATSGYPDLQLWFTETGINGGTYYDLQPRREARQRTILPFVMESFGYAKEWNYNFSTFDQQGSGLSMYLVDQFPFGTQYGNMRAGGLALHVMGEALFGCPATPTNLAFGASGSMADSLFAGEHYTSSAHDVVVLATNGVESASVTLNVSASGTVTYWDGWGKSGTATASGGQVTIPVNDLLTYVFLPSGTTVSVHDTDQGAIALSSATNIALNATITDEHGTNVKGVVNDGSFAGDNSGVTSVTPYVDATATGTLTVSAPGTTIGGYSLMAPGNPWQNAGWGILACSLTVDGTVVDSWTCASAESFVVPSGSNQNNDDPATRTSWWTGAFSHVRSITPVTGSTFTISVTGSYGGQPDAASSTTTTASNVTTPTYSEGDAQQVQLVEVQIYEASAPPPSNSGFLTIFNL